jgi:hypothetical protein
LFNGKPQATAFNRVAGLKRSRLRLAVKQGNQTAEKKLHRVAVQGVMKLFETPAIAYNPRMDEQLRVIYSARDLVDAQLMVDYLHEHGIKGWLQNAALQGAIGELPPGDSSSPKVAVAHENYERAEELKEAFEEELANPPPEPQLAFTEPGPWPTCPECERTRQTVCPVCGAADDQFSPADGIVDASEADTFMLICDTCDEPFMPEFYQQCQWCNHDFGEGRPRPQAEVYSDQPLFTSRTKLVVLVLVGLLGLVCAYFWSLTQGN